MYHIINLDSGLTLFTFSADRWDDAVLLWDRLAMVQGRNVELRFVA